MAAKLLMISLLVPLLITAAPSAHAHLIGLRNTVQVIVSDLRCSLNGLAGTGTGTNVSSSAPLFPNASVQVQCGRALVGIGTTDSTGSANVTIYAPDLNGSSRRNICRLRINTPLSTCNPQLPSTARLVSPLKFVTTAIPYLFQLQPTF